jgi:hypothetical protein
MDLPLAILLIAKSEPLSLSSMDVIKDYRINSSYTRWAALGFSTAMCLTIATYFWQNVSVLEEYLRCLCFVFEDKA